MNASSLSLRRFTPQIATMLILAAGAWLVTIEWARDMDAMPGTMGLGFPVFILAWLLMMAAMMLPSVAPVASMYSRSVRSSRLPRLALFTAGYLVVWTAAGLPAFGTGRLAEWLAEHHGRAATGLAAGLFATTGLYQLSSLKDRCLAHCRSPFSLLLRYGSYRGALRDLRAGLHHGGYCLPCCWSLMLLLVALGVMNTWAMIAVAAVVLVEKLSRRGELVARLVGAGALVLAVAVIWIPDLAPGLQNPPL